MDREPVSSGSPGMSRVVTDILGEFAEPDEELDPGVVALELELEVLLAVAPFPPDPAEGRVDEAEELALVVAATSKSPTGLGP